MNCKHIGKLLALGVILTLGVGWGPVALGQLADIEDDGDFPDGTAAGVVVTNTAALNFNVAGVEQAEVVSDPVDFRVDRRLRVSVTGIQDEDWTPGFQNAYLRYNVANLSNSVINIFLGAVEGDSPDFTAAFPGAGASPNVRFCDHTASNDCNTANPTFIDRLVNVPEDVTREVYMYFDIPLTAVDGDEAPWHLVAAVANPTDFPTVPTDSDGQTVSFAGAAGELIGVDSNENSQPGVTPPTSPDADAPLAIQDVFADGEGTASAEFATTHGAAIGNPTLTGSVRNGQHSDVIKLVISTPTMAINKTSRVVYDPVNGGCALDGDGLFEDWETQDSCDNNPRRLPGAIVEYKIVVSNTSTSATAATDVEVSDEPPASTSAIENTGDTFFGTAFPNPFVAVCGNPPGTPAAVTAETVDGGFDADLDDCAAGEEGIVIFYVVID